MRNARADQQHSPTRGFTLVELIAVMVILSIIATIGVGFVVRATESYQSTQTRALLVNTARQSIERMTRQLRGALPYSVRLTNADLCLQFIPIAAGGNYFDSVPDQQNGASASATISASPITVDFGAARYIAIGAMSAGEIYGATPESLATYNGYSGGQLQFTSKQWRRNSINKRFYLLDDAQAFCLMGKELRFYSGIDPQDANVDLTTNFDILARGVSGSAPFAFSNGSENRNASVTIALDFTSGGETINYIQRALIRNVP